jgi:hypothetical protein
LKSGGSKFNEKPGSQFGGNQHHLVWNRRQKKRASREDPYQRMLERGRDEWVVSEEQTHEPLISREQAEAVLLITTPKQKHAQRVRRGDFLLSGMLFTPDGVPYWADAPADAYRVGNKGKRISRWQIESAVLDRLQHDIRSPNFQRKLVAEMHRQADAIDIGNERIDDELAVRKKQIGNLLGLAAEGSKAAVARVRELEAEVEQLEQQQADVAGRRAVKQRLSSVTEESLAHLMLSLNIFAVREFKDTSDDPLLEVPEFVEEMNEQSVEARSAMRRKLTSLLDRVTFDPVSRQAVLHYRLTGVEMASPRGFEPRLPP